MVPKDCMGFEGAFLFFFLSFSFLSFFPSTSVLFFLHPSLLSLAVCESVPGRPANGLWSFLLPQHLAALSGVLRTGKCPWILCSAIANIFGVQVWNPKQHCWVLALVWVVQSWWPNITAIHSVVLREEVVNSVPTSLSYKNETWWDIPSRP